MSAEKPDEGEVGDETGDASGYTHKSLPAGGHVQYRKCAACGATDMAPISAFAGTGTGGASETGLEYKCGTCGSEVKIADTGAFFMGGVYSLFWGAVSYWAFTQGILWYIRHPGYFSDYRLSFLPLDLATIGLALGVIALTGWLFWTFLLGPLKALLAHPVTTESRAKTPEETAEVGRSRRSALLSFFVYPLFLWVPFLGIVWALDAMGVNLRDNEFMTYGGGGIVLALLAVLGKRFGANALYAFIGMVFWLAVFVTVIFTWR